MYDFDVFLRDVIVREFLISMDPVYAAEDNATYI